MSLLTPNSAAPRFARAVSAVVALVPPSSIASGELTSRELMLMPLGTTSTTILFPPSPVLTLSLPLPALMPLKSSCCVPLPSVVMLPSGLTGLPVPDNVMPVATAVVLTVKSTRLSEGLSAPVRVIPAPGITLSCRRVPTAVPPVLTIVR